MRIFLSLSYIRQYRRKIRNNPQLAGKVKEKISAFKTNPANPNLYLHKLKRKKQEAWSFSVERNLRILFIYIPEGVLFIHIGSHDEVY
ncbi:hypothetical protein A3D03_00975 [Candidatus Gottesmanbacteria bacterium RIFCSPHIGHO2_02_FULL_40_13]|uniref:Plasmid stabilization protein n=1 Tax=Candidatus Gottesmanbacteria bacterium RIFCSPHIGHO2_02_FULL_40_13 TaxID=1798384 RepID=A0A1F6A699_9BACT|nr:MAG: hypothetical protein A3D03_00975 [Candidatus Gottesmanbacteria bacterium RIFCSPHIGHO2_02_FULL_40_13]